VDTINIQIAVSVFYILKTTRNFNIAENFKLLMFIAITPAIVGCALYITFLCEPNKNADESGELDRSFSYYTFFFYYDYRIFAIATNLVFYSLGHYYSSKIIGRNIDSNNIGHNNSVNTLLVMTKRFMLYPVASALSRFGYLIYETKYGFDFEVANEKDDSLRYTLAVISVALTPLAPIGYFVIFMTTQPNANKHLKRRWDRLMQKLGCKDDLVSEKNANDEFRTNTGNKLNGKLMQQSSIGEDGFDTSFDDDESFHESNYHNESHNSANESVNYTEFDESTSITEIRTIKSSLHGANNNNL
jgi:hypothetical protein